MPPILDVAIGLLFVYLLFSLIVSAARELCVAFTRSSWDKRAELLREGIGQLFRDKDPTTGFTKEFFKHPLIEALSPSRDNALPNYIPRETFVSTVLDLIVKPDSDGPRTAEQISASLVGSLESRFMESATIVLGELSRKYPGVADITRCFEAFDSVATDPAQRNNFTSALGNLKANIVSEITTAGASLAAATTAAANAPDDQSIAQSLSAAQTKRDALVAHRTRIEALENLLPQFSSAATAVVDTLNPELRRTLLALYEDAGRDIEEFKQHLGAWFDRSMDRVTGWYKKYTQGFILVLGLVLAFASNVDSLHIIDTLSTDPILRKQIVKSATEYVKKSPGVATKATDAEATMKKAKEVADKELDPKKKADAPGPVEELEELKSASSPFASAQLKNAVRDMNGFGLPIGWHEGDWDKTWRDLPSGLTAILGWMLTALAASLGAPFWFDTLNKIVTIRAGGRAPEEKNPGENGGKSRVNVTAVTSG